MNWEIFGWIILGIIIGAGGYYLYDEYAGTVVSRIRKLEAKLAALKTKAVADVRKVV
jgi:hypothetical protein